MDWVKSVEDSLLQDDLLKCFAGAPTDRFSSAGELAKSLRGMEDRRAAQAAKAVQIEAQKKRTYLLGVLRQAALAMLVVALVVCAFYLLKDVQAGKYGALEIQTSPEGAEVWDKGVRIGTTPYQASRMKPVKFTYTLRVPDYAPLEKTVSVAPRQLSTLLVFLTPVSSLPAVASLGDQFANPPSPPSVTASTVTNTASLKTRAVVIAVEGAVEFTPKGTTNWQPARVQMVLSPGDRIRTKVSSRASLRMPNRSLFRINERTEFEITTPDTFQIRTPQATASIRG